VNTPLARAPFGDPDASRGGLEDFVDFQGVDGIATRNDDLRARVIVGRKGAGKTLYLRRAREFASTSDNLYADDIQQNLPSTTDIVSVANLYSKGVLVEKWMAIWRCAILRSLASHMLCNERLAGTLTVEEQEGLRKDFTAVMRHAATTGTPLTVYSQVVEIIRDPAFSARWLDGMVAHRQWEELEYRLAQYLDRFPPVCFYIDAIDDEFRHAPAFWLMCQKGLFYQVMRLLRDTRLGGRLHVFICIRDHVYTAVFGSEHATRYLDPLHIRLLEWDSRSIAYFLEQKIRRLDAAWLTDQRPTVDGWLGTAHVQNERRRLAEPTSDYVLRHTRLLPRDVVTLGNELCKRMRTRSGGVTRLSDTDIRGAVHTCARLFGREQLEICANQISSDMMHEGAALQRISEIYTNTDPTFTGSDVYQESVRVQLGQFLQSIGRDRFDREAFLRVREQGRDLFDGHTDVMAVLWQNGLLGMIPSGRTDGRAVFYSAAAHHDLWIEDAAPRYAFHPCLIDALALQSDGPGSLPVTPVALDEI
jgi:hypothetical protein